MRGVNDLAMIEKFQDDPRRATNPLFNQNKLKLGTFGTNVSGGCAITKADGALEINWSNVSNISKIADDIGLEALVPVARWRGFGGETDFNAHCFETYTWAAGLGGQTEQAAVFSTSHIPTMHPILAAKQATTIDHITNGRFALNMVVGWYQPEIEMFGNKLMEHDTRYDYADEWIEVMKLLWTEEEEFTYEGKYFQVPKGFAQPKPIQAPFPALMNAGGSERGKHFGAKHCDMMFQAITSSDPSVLKAEIETVREMARTEYGREIQVWTNSYVVHGDTEDDAKAYYNHYVNEMGDWKAADNLIRVLGINSKMVGKEAFEGLKSQFMAGYCGYPLIGTAEMIADGLAKLSELGFNGSLLSWVDYEAGLKRFNAEVMPLLEQKGLRTRT
jgi:alkanesulfonate monooxygenase SsuD/methylene tetrahydromethanopterin reductase-like flavin-dependent oxidoreductase (luciferase family)